MTVTQPYQKRMGITLRRQTTMADAMKSAKPRAPHTTFQARKVADQLRHQIPARQQAHWSRLQAEQKMRDAVQREALLGERRAMIGYRTDGRFAPHIESRLREIEGHL